MSLIKENKTKTHHKQQQATANYIAEWLELYTS